MWEIPLFLIQKATPHLLVYGTLRRYVQHDPKSATSEDGHLLHGH